MIEIKTETKTIQIPFSIGDILTKKDPDPQVNSCRFGVLRSVMQPGVQYGPPLAGVGDMEIQHSAGTSTISNDYDSWRKVDDEEWANKVPAWYRVQSHWWSTKESDRDEYGLFKAILGIDPWEEFIDGDEEEMACAMIARLCSYVDERQKMKQIRDEWENYTKDLMSRFGRIFER